MKVPYRRTINLRQQDAWESFDLPDSAALTMSACCIQGSWTGGSLKVFKQAGSQLIDTGKSIANTGGSVALSTADLEGARGVVVQLDSPNAGTSPAYAQLVVVVESEAQ